MTTLTYPIPVTNRQKLCWSYAKNATFLNTQDFTNVKRQSRWHATPCLDKDTGELVPCVRPGSGGDILHAKTEELTVHFEQPVDYTTAFEKVQSLWGDFVRRCMDAEAEIDRLFGEPPPGKKRVVLTLAAHARI